LDQFRISRFTSPDPPEECWHVFYDDVRVGVIALRIGRRRHDDEVQLYAFDILALNGEPLSLRKTNLA
jgi:ATP-dependent DNA ligase